MKRRTALPFIFCIAISLPVSIAGFQQRFHRQKSSTTKWRGQQVQYTLYSSKSYSDDGVNASFSPPSVKSNDDPFLNAMIALCYSETQREHILAQLQDAGLWDSHGSSMLHTVTNDFNEHSTISTLLIQDFGLSPLVAHQTRAALQYTRNKAAMEVTIDSKVPQKIRMTEEKEFEQTGDSLLFVNTLEASSSLPNHKISLEQRYKSTIVSTSAQQRDQLTYSLPLDDFPVLQAELQDFFRFMTLPSTDAQGETPIRAATANIYMRHAKLFLGWYWDNHIQQSKEKDCLSLHTIFPSKEKEHAAVIVEFVLWLRTTRRIAVSYEANLLRGLSKLLKWRFRKESCVDDEINAGNASFGDIPVIRELRKLHRDANRRQAVAPRVSNEDYKWLSWPDYLQVVQNMRADLQSLLRAYEDEFAGALPSTITNKQWQRSRQIQQRQVAVAFQKYLILAVFANIPDRQRTIRELEIGRSFVKDARSQQWCVKHAPEDYKTGKTYGERPALHLPTSLTKEIDAFIDQWRPVFLERNVGLNDTAAECHHLFLGVRTGTPLTSDAVYHTVSKTCYQYAGKRTNPHLLRDMIVTHVRESSNASEQQLEALALFMGHSPAIQRKSYDRRTLTKKVAPAVALMQQVNAGMVLPNNER